MKKSESEKMVLKTYSAKINKNTRVEFAHSPELLVRIETYGQNEVVLFEETFLDVIRKYAEFKEWFEEKEKKENGVHNE